MERSARIGRFLVLLAATVAIHLVAVGFLMSGLRMASVPTTDIDHESQLVFVASPRTFEKPNRGTSFRRAPWKSAVTATDRRGEQDSQASTTQLPAPDWYAAK